MKKEQNKTKTWHTNQSISFDYAGRFKVFRLEHAFLLYKRPSPDKVDNIRGLSYVGSFDTLKMAKKIAGLL